MEDREPYITGGSKMNRPIKFRAWDTKVTQPMWTHEETLSLIMFQGRVLDGTADDKDGRLERFKIMQYTGHMDGDGNEIYDGDIKEWRFNHHIWVSVCYWSDVDWGFRWKRVKHNEKFENYEDEYETEEIFEEAMKGGCQRSVGFDRWCKIIGNIYENPELLK